MPVSHILSSKGRNVITALPATPIGQIAKTLADNRIGAIVITTEAGSIAGIVSERDVVRAIATSGASVLSQPVSTVMSTKVKTCKEGDTEADLMSLMTANRIRHLPVVKNDKIVGMISIGDVVKFRIEAIEREAEEMKAYIASAG
jgi:CBS domain-containing protein